MIDFFGGGETHTLNLYKNLLKKKASIHLLVPLNSALGNELTKQNLSYNTTTAFKFFKKFKFLYKLILAKDVYKICKRQKINTVICNTESELNAVKLVAKFLPIKIVLTRHLPNPVKKTRVKGIDGIIAVSPSIEKDLQVLNKQCALGIKKIDFIAPFFNDDSMLNFKPTESREVFFKANFGITINKSPILCMAANMYADNRKNQLFLIKAIQKLVYEKNTPIQLMLAGSGPLLEQCEKLVKQLNLEQYVHCLGFTKKISDLLYHSDIKILTSTEEAFGLSLVEAALLKKPLIGTAGTGMETIIKDNKTGLLFENNNLDDLINKIKILVNDQALQQELGQSAFNFVSANFLTQTKLQKFDDFLNAP